MTTLGDLAPDVVLKLGNRTDLNTGTNPTRVIKWLWQAYKSLTMSYPFEELELTYEDAFIQGQDIYPYPADARAIITLSYKPGSNPQVLSQPVRRKHIRVIRRYSSTLQGPPSIYGPFNRTVLVRPIPDQTYPFFWDYWQLPQPFDPADFTTLDQTVVLIPLDWQEEVLEYYATMLGHMDLLERDKAGELRQLLFGDPKDPSAPGIIKKKLLIHAAENVDSDYSIRPKVRAYSNIP